MSASEFLSESVLVLAVGSEWALLSEWALRSELVLLSG